MIHELIDYFVCPSSVTRSMSNSRLKTIQLKRERSRLVKTFSKNWNLDLSIRTRQRSFPSNVGCRLSGCFRSNVFAPFFWRADDGTPRWPELEWRCCIKKASRKAWALKLEHCLCHQGGECFNSQPWFGGWCRRVTNLNHLNLEQSFLKKLYSPTSLFGYE